MIDKAIQDSHGKRKPNDSLEMEKQERDSYFGNLIVKYGYLFYYSEQEKYKEKGITWTNKIKAIGSSNFLNNFFLKR